MILPLLVLLAQTDLERGLAEDDRLAAQVRAAPTDEEKRKRAGPALAAYAALIAERPKDPKLVPRLRRRRVSLLRHLGRSRAALEELDLIVAGRARRKDKARALYDGARLLERAGDAASAEKRLARVLRDYRDVVRVRADAAFARGRVLEIMMRPAEAERAYRFVVDKCSDHVKPAIAAYDALALLAIKAGKTKVARRWLRACMARYEKRAARGDNFGAYVSRLLGDMKAPRKLAAASKSG